MAQKRIRMLLESFFSDTVQGIPADEDGGGMSAFVVFSMMGFYPVTPGIPTYNIGSLVFDKVTLHLRMARTFKVLAHNNSHDNKYVQSASLNSHTMDQVWFQHAAIASGGTLELMMSDHPQTLLGSKSSTFPPVSMTINPESIRAVIE